MKKIKNYAIKLWVLVKSIIIKLFFNYDKNLNKALQIVSPFIKQPIIISFKNDSDNIIQDFEFLNAYDVLFNRRIPIPKNGIPNISYDELMSWFIGKSLPIKKITVIANNESKSISEQQVLEILTFHQKTINGNTSMRSIVPVIDAYQVTTTMSVIDENIVRGFYIDQFTSLKIRNIYPKTTVKILFYPE